VARSATERFMAKVEKTDDGCWIWTASKGGQYGKFCLNNRTETAHRASYVLFKGWPEPSTVIHHRCGNKLCVNPDHLQATTHHENVAEGLSRTDLLRRIEKLEAAILALQEDKHGK
jgi:hypothetical protein